MSTSLGIDIGGTNIKAAVVHADGRVAAFETSAWSGGAEVDAKVGELGSTALHIAAVYNKVEVASILIDKDAASRY